MKIIKKIYLAGFSNSQIKYIKKNFLKSTFITDNKISYKPKMYNAIIANNRSSIKKILKKIDFKKDKMIKWIHLPGAGIEEFSFLKNKHNVVFTNNKTIHGTQVAEHAMALLLALTRKLNLIIKYGQKIKFDKRPIELKNKNTLIIGYGGVGSSIAKKTAAFGMNVKVVNNSYKSHPNYIKNFFLYNKLHKAIKNTDVLFITVPLTEKSKNIINGQIIKKLNKGGFIINVSRGGCLNIKSVEKYLKKDHLGGVGLDVTDPEPLPKNHNLFKMKNVIITPHTGIISDNFSDKNFDLTIENIKRYLKNRKLKNIVSSNKWY